MSCISPLGYDLLSSVMYTADGSASDFTIVFSNIDSSFPLFLNADTYIASNGTATRSGYIRVFTQGGSGIWIEQLSGWTMPEQNVVRFSSPPANGTIVLIRRDSRRDLRKIDAQSGASTDADRDLDIMYLHPIFIAQEMSDDNYLAGCRLDEQVAYAGNVYTKTGNGSWTTFTLSDADNTETALSEKQIEVHINGVYQHESSYTVEDVADVSTVTFSSAPPNGYAVEVRIVHSAIVPITTIQNGSVTCDKLAEGAVCSLDKFDLDAEGTDKYVLGFKNPGTAFGSYQLDSDWISDFDAQVQTSRLDQMDAPTAPVDINNQKLINVATPTNPTDGVNKEYVDSNFSTTSTRISTQSIVISVGGTGYNLNAGFDFTSVNVQLLLSDTYYGLYVTTLADLRKLTPYLNKTYFSAGITGFTQFYFSGSNYFSLQKTGNVLTVTSSLGSGFVSMVVTFIKDG